MVSSTTFFAFVTAAILPCTVGAVRKFTKQDIDWSQHQYVPAGPDDVRSPCPGLNTLANHGFLDHTGLSITVDDLLQASLDVYNVHSDVLQLFSKIGLTTSGLYDELTLETIRQHDSIEHDVSLSREDMALGNHWDFDESIYSTLASSNEGADYYNWTSAAWTQKERLRIALESNSGLKNTGKEFFIRSQESTLYLAAMGDIVKGEAPKEYVDIWFREERLPLAEGWSVPINEANLTAVKVFRDLIQEHSEWTATEGQAASLNLTVIDGIYLLF